MSNIEKTDNGSIIIKAQNKGRLVEQEIVYDSATLSGVYTAIRNLIAQLVISKGKWEGKTQRFVMVVVKEIIEFSEGYKYLAGQDKKTLVMLVLNEIFNKELDESELDDEIKSLILQGINIVIEPALEIAIYAAKGNIKINKKKLSKLCFFCDLE